MPIQHGRASGYDAGCRCVGCRYAVRRRPRGGRPVPGRPKLETRRQGEYRRELRRNYGITPVGLEILKAAQGFCCAICRTPFPLHGGKQIHVDHCHRTGRVRGVLCSGCNVAIGKLGDNAAGVRRALDYLEAFEAKGKKS